MAGFKNTSEDRPEHSFAVCLISNFTGGNFEAPT